MGQSDSSDLTVSGVEVKYMPAHDLMVQKSLKYYDALGLLPLLERLNFDQGIRKWDPINLLLTGPKGNGKSLLLAYYAQTTGIPYLAIDCSEETKERHLKGGFIVKGGSTPFVLGTVANAIHVANQHGVAMLVFEELNALSPQRQKELNALTDFRKKLEIPELSWRLELNPGAKLFIAGTMNPSVYGGTYELNEDLKSRFFEIEMPYPPAAAEKQILMTMMPAGVQIPLQLLDTLIAIAQQTRQEQAGLGYALSTRDLVEILKSISRVGWEDGLFLAAQKFSSDDRKLVLDRIKDITKIAVHKDIKDRAVSNKIINP